MNQRIGNVGLLNLSKATAESVKGIEQIGNVGVVIYNRETAHLIADLNIGNIGMTIEVPEGYHFYNGILHVDEAYLQASSEPVKLVVNGIVILDKNVQADQIKAGMIHLIVNGKVYSPAHLTGLISQLISGSTVVEPYYGAPPRFENGEFTLTTSFLQAIEEPLYLVVNGVLSLSKDLNLEKFDEKISKLEVNGKILAYEEQEALLYKKTASLTTCRVEMIPEGFERIQKSLRLNAHTIRRFVSKKLYTKKPIVMEADVTREMLSKAIAKIHSSSFILCHESIEDLIYELCSLLDTEVLTYQHRFVLIEGEEVWSNEQFLALDEGTNFIVNGELILDKDVKEEVLRAKVSALDILGEVTVPDKKIKGFLQNIIRVHTGSVEEERVKDPAAVLHNVGELSL